ncbi:TPA: hypothetical protein ACGVAX_002752 [Vibrio vulnificus]
MKKMLSQYGDLIQWLTGLGLPISLIISSWLISTSVETTKINSGYVKLAVDILANDKLDEPMSDKDIAIRQWALRIIDEKSPVKLTEEEKEAIVENGLYQASESLKLDFYKAISDPPEK